VNDGTGNFNEEWIVEAKLIERTGLPVVKLKATGSNPGLTAFTLNMLQPMAEQSLRKALPA
jgi:hypothetical protein